MSDSIFRAWDVFLLRAPVALGAAGLPTDGNHLDMLRAAAADAELRSSIALATPALGRLLDRIESGDTAAIKDSQLRRAALAVLRYDIRMRTRPTPFGMFAGVAGGRFDTSAKLRRGDGHRTRTHADMHWLLGVVQQLHDAPGLLRGLTVRAHPALVRCGDRVLLDCPSPLGASLADAARATVSIRISPVLELVLAEAEQTTPVAALTAAVVHRFGAPAERVAELLRALVEQEFLITDLRPPLDGGDPLTHVISVLGRIDPLPGAAVPMLSALREVDSGRRALDLAPLGPDRPGPARIMGLAREIHEYETPLHVDTALDLDATLPHEVQAEAERAAELMWRMSTDKTGLFALREYHTKFLERYGADRLVGIRELLDPARGMGPPAGYNWPNSEETKADPPVIRDASRARLMHTLVAAALRDRVREVELTDDMIAVLAPEEPSVAEVPNSCEITFHIVAPSEDAIAAGDFRLVLAPSPGSHQAGATFARFGDLLAPDIAAVVAAESDARPIHIGDALCVDLSFLPRSGKAANLAHTVARSGNRISVGLPDGDAVREIRLADIAIGATTERLRAVHLPSGRELAPVLDNMVSPVTQAPNASRLLWEIGLEGQRLWEPWNWGGLADMPFVPRVRRGRFVLAPAVWRMDVLAGVSAVDFATAVQRWRAEWNVPDRILAVQMDQRLLFDLTDRLHLELLRDELRKDPALVAHEVPGGDGYDGIDGHAVEVVVPMSRRATEPPRLPHVGTHTASRSLPGLGSDWLYLNLYLPSDRQDDFIRGTLPELVEQAGAHGVDRWFFIRYNDPAGPHLRVRFHGTPDGLWGGAAPVLGARLRDWQRSGLLGRYSVDQYDAEIERYGGPDAMAAAERVFEADSVAAIRFLELVRDPDCVHSLDAFATISLASLAAAFGVPAGTSGTVGEWEDDAAAAWLSLTGSRTELPRSFRSDVQRWRELVDPYRHWPALRADRWGAAALEALEQRDDRVRSLRAVLNGSPTPHQRLIGSLMHMTCNRLFGGDSARERAAVATARGAVQDNFNRRRHTR